MDWAIRFKEWRAHAQTVADIAQALAAGAAEAIPNLNCAPGPTRSKLVSKATFGMRKS